MKNTNLEFEDIIGRYFNLKVKKQNYRIYVEEAGQGNSSIMPSYSRF